MKKSDKVLIMELFKIRIAGLVFGVEPLFESTRAYCLDYLAEGDAVCYIQVTEDDLVFEQQMLDIEAREEGMKLRRFTGPFLERTAIQRKIAEKLLEYNTLLLHGSTVAVDGAAYLFTAACGTGKSTHTRLWREVFGDRAVMINDDKPFLRLTAEGVLACGSPWSGKHGLDSNVTVPLRGICILERGGENRIRRITPGEALPMLQKQSIPPLDPRRMGKFQSQVEELAEKVPLWHMACNKDPEAARIAHETMSDKSQR